MLTITDHTAVQYDQLIKLQLSYIASIRLHVSLYASGTVLRLDISYKMFQSNTVIALNYRKYAS